MLPILALHFASSKGPATNDLTRRRIHTGATAALLYVAAPSSTKLVAPLWGAERMLNLDQSDTGM